MENQAEGKEMQKELGSIKLALATAKGEVWGCVHGNSCAAPTQHHLHPQCPSYYPEHTGPIPMQGHGLPFCLHALGKATPSSPEVFLSKAGRETSSKKSARKQR